MLLKHITGPSLHQRRSSARKLPEGSERVQPQRSILKGEHGYEVNTPPAEQTNLRDLVLDQALRINALELTLYQMSRDIQQLVNGQPPKRKRTAVEIEQPVSHDAAKPVHILFPDVQQKAKPHQASGIAVPGNEAEVLEPSEGDEVETYEDFTDVDEPQPLKHVDNVVHITEYQKPAANDGDVVQTTKDKVDLDDLDLEAYAHDQFVWSKEEARKALHQAYTHRNEVSLRKNGMSYDDVRLKRLISHRRAHLREKGETYGIWYSPDDCDSNFKEFDQYCVATNWQQVKVLNRMLDFDRAESEAYAYQAYRTHAIKSGAGVRKIRAEAARMWELREKGQRVGPAHRFACSVMFARMNRTAEEYAEQRRWKWSENWTATKRGWAASIDGIKGALRMGTETKKIAELRALYEREPDPNKYAVLDKLLSRDEYVVRTAPSRGSVVDWSGMTMRQRMDQITREVLKRKLYTPLEMTVLHGMLTRDYSKQLDSVILTPDEAWFTANDFSEVYQELIIDNA